MKATELRLYEQGIKIYELEHYILHALSELNSKRNDGWTEDFYRKELKECGKIIDDHLKELESQIDLFEKTDATKTYEKEKLSLLRKRIDEIQRP